MMSNFLFRNFLRFLLFDVTSTFSPFSSILSFFIILTYNLRLLSPFRFVIRKSFTVGHKKLRHLVFCIYMHLGNNGSPIIISSTLDVVLFFGKLSIIIPFTFLSPFFMFNSQWRLAIFRNGKRTRHFCNAI